MEVPAGFVPIDFGIHFLHLLGPCYHKVGSPVLHLGFRIERRHCNSLNTVHGGFLATLADIATVRALVFAAGGEKRAFTLSLNVDYISTAHEGAWLEAKVSIQKSQGSVGFASVDIFSGDSLVVAASGAFKFITPRPEVESKKSPEPRALAPVPDNFVPYDISHMPFMQLIGPIYKQTDADIITLGVQVGAQHCNSLGTVHGGFVATIADVAAGRALIEAREDNVSAVTISLHLDYIGTAFEGAWLHTQVTLKKANGSVGFCDIEVLDGERLVMRASGAFKYLLK